MSTVLPAPLIDLGGIPLADLFAMKGSERLNEAIDRVTAVVDEEIAIEMVSAFNSTA